MYIFFYLDCHGIYLEKCQVLKRTTQIIFLKNIDIYLKSDCDGKFQLSHYKSCVVIVVVTGINIPFRIVLVISRWSFHHVPD